jgi:SAM-dependent methyltransferase/uncharacterized protein YbaR (Trm112 family)
MKEEIHIFDRSKIYENLKYEEEPAGYHSKVPWVVQQQIAATNGRHYLDLIGKLSDYPSFNLPLRQAHPNQLMLDIGCGWGRWLVAGAKKGYIPIGIDLRLEFCKTARSVLSAAGKHGYTLVADLQHLPFVKNSFDLVWSFSVIQHTHYDRFTSCLSDINRILSKNGFTFLEFPNKNGVRNFFGPARNGENEINDINSWAVRYYTPEEYRSIFASYMDKIDLYNHSFLGIGILKEDLKYVSFKNKIICLISLLGSFFTQIVPPLKNISDSLYIKAQKKSTNDLIDEEVVNDFIRKHRENPNDNLNICSLLVCPLTGDHLVLNDERDKLINFKLNKFYPIIESIPILVRSEIQSL